jgi:hypothetical protein
MALSHFLSHGTKNIRTVYASHFLKEAVKVSIPDLDRSELEKGKPEWLVCCGLLKGLFNVQTSER